MRFLNRCIVWFLLGAGNLALGHAQDTPGSSLDYKEVYDLIKSQLPDLNESTLGDAAARGIIRSLAPRVQLVTETDQPQPPDQAHSISKAMVLESEFAYLLLKQIGPETPQSFQSAFQNLAASNQLKGLILDLRFALGDDYQAAVQLVDQFFTNKEPLLDWGKGIKYSNPKEKAISLPVVLLVNNRTAGAAEAMAAVLRQGVTSLLLGSRTAGQASVYREFTLSTGQHLNIAAQPVKIGSEGQTIPADGLVPDIPVTVPLQQERAWLEDPYKIISMTRTSGSGSEDDATGSGPNAPNRPRRRINEADLVRMMEEGEMPGMLNTFTSSSSHPAKPIIRDPALARGLDFLKGLAVIRPFRLK